MSTNIIVKPVSVDASLVRGGSITFPKTLYSLGEVISFNTNPYNDFTNGACASRGQMHSNAKYQVDDYKDLRTIVWCNPGATFYQGLISSTTNWVHSSPTYQGGNIAGFGNAPVYMKLDISNVSGSYYLALQKITGLSGFCYVNGVALLGDTFSYANPS